MKPLAKASTGIPGLDEIAHGGLPRGRTTLVAGGAGSGKTLLALEFLLHGILDYGEPGVFIAFEERPEDLATNMASLGVDLRALQREGRLVVDFIHIDKNMMAVAGAFDLEGLFVRLDLAVRSVGAKRVALDTLERIFGGFSDHALLRNELNRLFLWLKERGLTAVATAEKGEGQLTRHGLEEYVSDCVIFLDHRVDEQISTRRLRIIKYRGSSHGMDEYPFLIDEHGLSFVPLSSLGLEHRASQQRISTGIAGLDDMMGGKGLYRGATALVSGSAGTGKTILSAHFADAVCRSGERCLYFAFEESFDQLARNMEGVGIDLGHWRNRNLLKHVAARPSLYGLETHLLQMHKAVEQFEPAAVVIDPISNLVQAGTQKETRSLLMRLIDFLKSRNITAVMTSLTSAGRRSLESTGQNISSLTDTWLLLRNIEHAGERNRGLYILKSRGMSHSNQVREFIITPDGVRLIPAYLGAESVFTGSARLAQEAKEQAEKARLQQEIQRRERVLERRRNALEAQIAALRSEFQAQEEEAQRVIAEMRSMQRVREADREEMARSQHTATAPS